MQRLRFAARYALAAVVGSVLFAGCDFDAATDAFDQFDVIVELEPIETMVTASVVDAKTGRFIETDLTLRFAGPDAAAVIDMYSDPIGSMKISGGLGAFGIRNDRVPIENAPVVLRVIASAPGFETSAAEVHLTESGSAEFVLRLASSSPALAPEGAGSASASTATAGGVTTTSTTLTSSTTNAGTSATVTIPAGTSFTTQSGAPAQGAVSTTLVTYHRNQERAIPLPTSANTTVVRADGSEMQSILTPLASAVVRATDAAGSTVARFDPPLRVEVELDPSLVYPLTGAPLAEGDELDVLTFEPDEGIWRISGKTRVRSAVGKTGGYYLFAEFSMEEDSAPSLLSYPVGPRQDSFPFCASLVYGVSRAGPDLSWTYALYDLHDRELARFGPLFGNRDLIAGAHPVEIPFFADEATDGWIRFTSGGREHTYRFALPMDCRTHFIDLGYDFSSVIDVTFDLQISSAEAPCPSGALRVTGTGVSGLVIMMYLVGALPLSATRVPNDPTWMMDAQGRITGGTLVVPGLTTGSTWTFSTSLNGTRFERTVTIDRDSVPLDISRDVRDAGLCAS